MIVSKPPMGWNSWNTFGENISEQLIMETADKMVEEGYLAAGYEYLIIDDCWSLRRRGEDGRIVPDPVKFPHGMKYVADYVHSKGLKFGMYSCAGLMTCADYPGSYDHEFVDAQTFADWGVDYLKYDYCNFPATADCQQRYRTMSMALKATGRDILFAACNWGHHECQHWMSSAGAHTYRSTGDIFDKFNSTMWIAQDQAKKLYASGPNCFNDMDMLTIGMYGKGNVGMVDPEDPLKGLPTDEEYKTQFALWCAFGSPLMIGGDIRSMNDYCKKLLQNKNLIAINQDGACNAPIVITANEDAIVFARHMSDNTVVLGLVNGGSESARMYLFLDEIGLPSHAPYALEAMDVFTGEPVGIVQDYLLTEVPSHGCQMYRCKIVKK